MEAEAEEVVRSIVLQELLELLSCHCKDVL